MPCFHLDRNSEWGVDGQVERGLEASVLKLTSFTLGCQVGERITGQPSAVPAQKGMKTSLTDGNVQRLRAF